MWTKTNNQNTNLVSSLWDIIVSALSLVTKSWFLGAGWHDPVTHQRHKGDSGNCALNLYIEVISHLCTAALVINSPCGRWLSASKSYWVFMSDKHNLHIKAALSHKWPTCTVSLICFLPLFARWHRICFCLPCYIFITAELCWYSALGRTKTWEHAQGLENMTSHALWRGKIPRGQSTVVSQRGSAQGSQRPLSDLTRRHVKQRPICLRRPRTVQH